MKRFLFTLCLLSLLSQPALAGLPSGTVTPASKTVAMNTPAAFFLTWRLARNGGAATVTVQSSQFVVRLGNSNGPILYTGSKSLSQTKNVTLNIDFFTFSESIALPRSVMQQAAKAGTGLVLQRAFTDDNFNSTLTKEVAISVGGSSNADFSVTRIDLSFSNGTNACVVKPGERLTATARIMAVGSGLLRGSWQVRENGGLGSYRTLRTVQIPVSSGSGTIVQSPPLPSTNNGQLDVRLVIESPQPAFEEPTLTCGIGGNSETMMQRPRDESRDAEIISPAPNSPLTAQTAIRWKAVKGAKAYRIEILADDGEQPVAAQIAKPVDTSTKPSALVLEKLQPGARYTVRVVAE